jgi:hypothetical protein
MHYGDAMPLADPEGADPTGWYRWRFAFGCYCRETLDEVLAVFAGQTEGSAEAVRARPVRPDAALPQPAALVARWAYALDAAVVQVLMSLPVVVTVFEPEKLNPAWPLPLVQARDRAATVLPVDLAVLWAQANWPDGTDEEFGWQAERPVTALGEPGSEAVRALAQAASHRDAVLRRTAALWDPAWATAAERRSPRPDRTRMSYPDEALREALNDLGL